MNNAHFPALVGEFMNDGKEAVYVYDYEQIKANCHTVLKNCSELITNHFDLCALPNLSVINAVNSQLSCSILIPSSEWKPYVQLAGVHAKKINLLSVETVAVENVEQAVEIVSSTPEGVRQLFVHHGLIGKLLEKSDLLLKLRDKEITCFCDIKEIPLQKSEKIFSEVNKLADVHHVRTALLHGEGLLDASCTLWLKVRNVKETRGKKYVIMSGGANILWDATHNGNASRKKYPVIVTNEPEEELSDFTFCGPLCTPQDTIAIDLKTQELLPGDVVKIENIGAAMYHKSPIYFIGHPKPFETMFYEGRLYPLCSL